MSNFVSREELVAPLVSDRDDDARRGAGAFRLSSEWSPALLRTTLGAIMFAHGAQKVFGWFGGFGLEGTLGYFTQSLNLPLPVALAIVAAELLGSVALIAGVSTRVAAAGIAAIMIGAVGFVHAPYGFFMNWFGTQAGEGYEYHLLALAMAVSLVLTGGGRFSLDDRLSAARAAKNRA